jgi:hypothetical protein
VEDHQVRVYKKISLTSSTYVLLTERKESLGIQRLSHSEFAEILLHQRVNVAGDVAGIRISSKH